jgi:hypothetical protein
MLGESTGDLAQADDTYLKLGHVAERLSTLGPEAEQVALHGKHGG